ncbi:MAG TPA: Nudix family hydrolase [Burkholderiaceae bacterium]|nr:Nudix family hydrolase [Burkholderiaceae bacterium]
MRRPVDVAVGVLIRPDGRFLLASRPDGKPYAHYWEFPGGKLEAGESVAHALARELHEELGIVVGPVRPWIVREFEYPHAHVRLHFCRVTDWSGELHAREGQAFRFCALDDLPDGPLLPATVPVLRWLSLPPLYAVTNAGELGSATFLERLERALAAGLKLVLFREPALDASAAESLFLSTLAHVRRHGGRLLVSSRHPAVWWKQADGVHLTSRDLYGLAARPDVDWVGASAHRRADLERATVMGADLASLGPVGATASHPGGVPMGWDAFAATVADSGVPVYAIGGMTTTDFDRAASVGAHGIAMQRALWAMA